MFLQNKKGAMSSVYGMGTVCILVIALLLVGVPVSANNGLGTDPEEHEEDVLLDPDSILTFTEEQIEEMCGVEIGQRNTSTGIGGRRIGGVSVDHLLDLNLVVSMVAESTRPCYGTFIVESQLCLAPDVAGAVVTGIFSDIGRGTKVIYEGCTTVSSMQYDTSSSGGIYTLKKHPDIRRDIGVHSWFKVGYLKPPQLRDHRSLVLGFAHAYLLVEKNTITEHSAE